MTARLVAWKAVTGVATLFLASTALGLVSSAVLAGEFGATFNCRLTCEYSSWHEGTVVRADAKAVTVRITRDILRHAPVKTFKLDARWYNLRKGDIVLVNYWTKPSGFQRLLERVKPKMAEVPGSMGWGAQLVAKINKKDKIIDNGMGYSASILGWFYWSARWDARVEAKSMARNGSYCWYAVLPNGKRILLYDERTGKGLYIKATAH